MEQLEAARSQTTKGIPEGPIVVLGKQKNYLFVGLTIGRVIEETCTHSSAHSSGHDRTGSPENHLCLDVEFFDSAGRALGTIVPAGQSDSVNGHFGQSIHDRIEEIFLGPGSSTRTRQRCGADPEPEKDTDNPGAPLIHLLREALPKEFIRKIERKSCPRWKCWLKLCRC